MTNTQYCAVRCQEVISRIKPETPAQDRQMYEAALVESPHDSLLHSRFAQYLEAMGNRAEAIAECRLVCELLPDLEWPQYHLGDLLLRAGRTNEAADCLRRALAIRSDFTQARTELRRIQANQTQALGVGR